MLVDGARVRWKAYPDWTGRIYQVKLRPDVSTNPYTGFMMVHHNVPWSKELKRQLEACANRVEFLTLKQQIRELLHLTIYSDLGVNPLLFLSQEEDIEVIGPPDRHSKHRRGKKHKMRLGALDAG